MLDHLMYRLHYVCAITEYGGKGVSGNADVFSVRDSGYSHEFEIKVSKADLMGELNSIEYVMNEDTLLGKEKPKNYQKLSKHNLYLKPHNPSSWWGMNSKPNQFSFVVTKELEEIAVKYLKDTPYGLYVIEDYTPVCKIKAKNLHKEKVDQNHLYNITRKACTEIVETRRKLARGIRCNSCDKHLNTMCYECIEARKRSREMQKEFKNNVNI